MTTPAEKGPAAARTSSGLASATIAVGLVVVFVGQRILAVGMAGTIVTAIGALCVLAAIGQKAISWRVATGAVRRVEATLLGSYAGVALALALYALSSTLTLIVLTVSLSALFFLELAYRRMPVAPSVELRRVQSGLETGLTLGLALVFVFASNYTVSKHDMKRDLSYFETSSPSGTTRSVLRRFGAPLRIYLFYPETSEVLGQLRPYFRELSGATRDVRVGIRDHALAPGLTRKHRVPDNGWVLLVKGEGGGEQAERFEIGVELEEARSRLRTLDERFQQALTRLTQPPRALSLTVGHGERSRAGEEGDSEADRTSGVAEILRRFNITSQPLGLAQGLATGVPEHAGAVAVLGPRARFLPEEAQALLTHVQRGGRLLLLVDPDTETGLEPVLAGLGLALEHGVLSSETKYLPRTRTSADHAIVHTNSYSAHPIVGTLQRHVDEAATFFIIGGALTRRAGATPAPQVSFPVRSGDEFWLDLDGDHTRDDDESLRSVNMVAVSTFAAQAGRPEGRAVVIADGDFVTDKVVENPGNLLLFIDSLRWLVGADQVQSDLTSEEDVRIEHTRDEDKLWFYATSFAAPIPLLLLGLGIGRRRRARAEGRR